MIHKRYGFSHINMENKRLKSGIKSLIKEILKESDNVIMRTKVEYGKMEDVLSKNSGIPFDDKEKQEIMFKQKQLGVKSTIRPDSTEIKFSISDMYNNNKINVLKKLKNMSDPTTLIYANFFAVIPMELEDDEELPPTNPQDPQAKKDAEKKFKEKNKVYIRLSQPFEDKGSTKLDILGDFIQQLEVKN